MEKAHKNMIGVYALRNITTGATFIGSSPSILNHLQKHYDALFAGEHESTELQKDWNEFGPSSFEFVCLESARDKYSLLARESFWIEKLNAIQIGSDHRLAHQYASPGRGRLTISRTLREELRNLHEKTTNDAIYMLIQFYKNHTGS